MMEDSRVNPRIMLVEDDAELAALVRDYLHRHDFDVTVVDDGWLAATEIISLQPDLVILDVMLPGQSGMDVCRQVRPNYTGPIVMLTALDEDFDQMLGLELGADDYIIKPVHPRLLLARIKALLRRVQKAPEQQPGSRNLQGLVINVSSRTVTLAQKLVSLTTAEFELLLLLSENIGEEVSRDNIMQQLRGFEYDGLDRSIDRRICRLRKKLQVVLPDQEIIKTVRGKGYLLCPIPHNPHEKQHV